MDLLFDILAKPNPELQQKQIEVLRRLYPALTETQLTEARENIEGYLQVALRIFNRVKNDPELRVRLQELERRRQEFLVEIRAEEREMGD